MRVILVNPSRAGLGNIPVNLPLLQAVLKAGGHETRIFDFSDYVCFQPEALDSSIWEGSEGTRGGKWSVPQLYFKQADPVDVERVAAERSAQYRGYGQHWVERPRQGLSCISDPERDFEWLCQEYQPDVVGISSLTADFPVAAKFIEPFKKRFGFLCIVGGVHAISMPDHALGAEVCDGICSGEGEAPLLEFLETLERGGEFWRTPGMTVRHNGVFYKNPGGRLANLDDLPPLDFHGFDSIHFYRAFDGRRYKMLNYSWSRGCPYSCSYCINALLHEVGGASTWLRRKSVSKAIEELRLLKESHGFEFIRFWDEDFTALPVSELRQFLSSYSVAIKLPFLIYARLESVTEEKLRLLADAGCVTIATGIESGNEETRRKVLNRQVSDEQILSKLRLIRESGIRVTSYNIIGLPGENRKKIFETIELNRKAPIANASCALLEPYPNTPIRQLCEAEGLPESYYPSYASFLGEPQFVPADMTKEELRGLLRTFPLYVHLPRYLFPMIRIAERETHEGDAVFHALAQLKQEFFMEKPVDEDQGAGFNPVADETEPGGSRQGAAGSSG